MLCTLTSRHEAARLLGLVTCGLVVHASMRPGMSMIVHGCPVTPPPEDVERCLVACGDLSEIFHMIKLAQHLSQWASSFGLARSFVHLLAVGLVAEFH